MSKEGNFRGHFSGATSTKLTTEPGDPKEDKGATADAKYDCELLSPFHESKAATKMVSCRCVFSGLSALVIMIVV